MVALLLCQNLLLYVPPKEISVLVLFVVFVGFFLFVILQVLYMCLLLYAISTYIIIWVYRYYIDVSYYFVYYLQVLYRCLFYAALAASVAFTIPFIFLCSLCCNMLLANVFEVVDCGYEHTLVWPSIYLQVSTAHRYCG